MHESANLKKANLTFGLSIVGFVLSYPFHSNFWGGLLTIGFSAAVIGGLADWFAVTALFKRPLGIKPGRILRTEIIPRNRTRIFSALAEMVQNELLTQNALKKQLLQYDMVEKIIDCLKTPERLAELEARLNELVNNLINDLKPETFEAVFDAVATKPEIQEDLHQMISSVLGHVREKNLQKPLAGFITQELYLFAQSPEVHDLLTNLIGQAFEDYARDNTSRKILQLFLPQPSQIAAELQIRLAHSALDRQFGEHTEALISEFLTGLQASEGEKLREYIAEGLRRLDQPLKTWIWEKGINSGQAREHLQELVNGQIRIYLDELRKNPVRRGVIRCFLQEKLNDLIESKHHEIGRMVREGLERFSNEELVRLLVRLIEGKSGDDLQMIRINGSAVGGLAGMLIYLINWLPAYF